MPGTNIIPVALDQELVKKLLDGLLHGAKGKALKVVISTDGHYYIESKELRMVIEAAPDGISMNSIRISNEKQSSHISAQELSEMKLTATAQNVIRALKEKYSPVFHSLADNIVVFSRAYGGS